MSESSGGGGINRLVRAFGYSVQGLRAAYRQEVAFRQEVWLTIPLVPLALWLGGDGIERALLIASWILVIIVELLNSAVEATVDRFGPEHHELSGRAKDMGSAAVLLSIGLAALVWGFILFS